MTIYIESTASNESDARKRLDRNNWEDEKMGIKHDDEYKICFFPSTFVVLKKHSDNMERTTEKYYTPTKDEFYIGFEFERFNKGGVMISNHPSNYEEWQKEICDEDWFSILLDDYEHNHEDIANEYRVKYLDKLDLASLGMTIENSGFAEMGDLRIDFNRDNIHSDTIDIYCVWDLRFKGRIRNISELKRVLSYIGMPINP